MGRRRGPERVEEVILVLRPLEIVPVEGEDHVEEGAEDEDDDGGEQKRGYSGHAASGAIRKSFHGETPCSISRIGRMAEKSEQPDVHAALLAMVGAIVAVAIRPLDVAAIVHARPRARPGRARAGRRAIG